MVNCNQKRLHCKQEASNCKKKAASDQQHYIHKNPCPTWAADRGTGQWRWMEEVPRRTSLVPLASPCFVVRLIGVETEALLDYQGGGGGGSFPLYGGTFARSYSVSTKTNLGELIFGSWHKFHVIHCMSKPHLYVYLMGLATLHRKTLGEMISVSSHNIYVLRSQPLHKIILSEFPFELLGLHFTIVFFRN